MANEISFESLVASMNPQMYAALKRSVECRKWPDGRLLSKEQLRICLEAIIRFEISEGVPEELRTGYIDRAGHHSESDPNEVDTLKWVKD